jgi:hypothetical protein
MALLDTLKSGLKKVGSLFDRTGPTYYNPATVPKVATSAPTVASYGAVAAPQMPKVVQQPVYAPVSPAKTPAPKPTGSAAAIASAVMAPKISTLQNTAGGAATTPVTPTNFTVPTSGTSPSTALGPTSRADAQKALETARKAMERRFAPTKEQDAARKQLEQAELALANVTAGQTARLADLRYYNPQGVFGGGQATIEGQIGRESTLQAIQAQGSLSAAQSAYDRLDQARQQEIQNFQTIQSMTAPDIIGTPTVNKSTGEVTAYVRSPDGNIVAQSLGNVGIDESFDLQSVIRNEATGQAFAVGTRNGQVEAVPIEGTQGLAPRVGSSGGVGVGGLSTKPLSGDAAKVYGFASTLIPELDQLKQLFQNNYSGTLRGAILGTDPNVVRLIDAAADKVGRLRSGGAVNKEEEARFRSAIVRKSDVLFGKSETTIAALDRYATEARTVLAGLESGLAGASGVAAEAPAGSSDPLDALLNELGY